MLLSYGIVTPAHDEEANLPRLACSLAAQTLLPEAWIIVDDGSTDATLACANALAESTDWVRVVELESGAGMARGGPIVRSFTAGVAELPVGLDIVVKVDADVSMEPDYFERLLEAFAAEPRLGMASGSAYELEDGRWRQRFGTGTSVWGAVRGYRHECLEQVMPLEQRMGWDSVDEHKAQVQGWDTRTLLDLPFFHHRSEAERDRSGYAAWRTQGGVSHYLGYRPSYLALRALYQATRDLSALGLIAGYLAASFGRAERCADLEVRSRVRKHQRLRNIGQRAREAMGARTARLGRNRS